MRWNIASRQEKEYCFSAILQQISRLHNSIIVVISPPFTIRMLEYDNMEYLLAFHYTIYWHYSLVL